GGEAIEDAEHGPTLFQREKDEYRVRISLTLIIGPRRLEGAGDNERWLKYFLHATHEALRALLHHRGIDDVDRLARRKGEDLVENIRELQLVFLARDVTDVRRRHHLVELQQRESGVTHRLILEHVDRRVTGPAGAQRRRERARLYQRRAAGVDQDRVRLHARQVFRGD